MRAAIAATLAVLAAFVFCALASAYFHWHSSVTAPVTAVCALGLLACGVWLNRSAGGDEEDDEEEEES
jgi:apolipoprotein N-acyltransferase